MTTPSDCQIPDDAVAFAPDHEEMASLDQPLDTVGFIMDYESGSLNDDEIIKGFQHLVDSGLAWSLQGSYGRMAAQLIDAGLVSK